MRTARIVPVVMCSLLPEVALAQADGPRIHAGEGIAGFFSETRGGGIWHDPGAKEDSFAVNGELLFVSPVPARVTAGLDPRYRWILEPRPHLGFSANTGGKTSKGYFGLTWTAMLAREVVHEGDGIRFDLLFGGSVNNGLHDRNLPDRKDLGGNLLFHVGAEIGYQIDPTWSVSLFFDHDSNGGLAQANQSLNSIGLRLGYAFRPVLR
ncbi:MAG: acyloxyacyl hydrolase [Microbispora sp.]|nr:acyloxyacyl hydrolase [Microbispora sp.]